MKHVKVMHYDAFSAYPNKGNPAGVVLDTCSLSDRDMQSIAYQVGFNETVFITKSDAADLRLRYFTPGHEMDLCGHATIAALFGLKTRGGLKGADSIRIETNVGVLPIQFLHNQDHQLLIRMKQDTPLFVEFNGDRERLAFSIGLTVKEIDEDKPMVYGYTGAWTLLIPIKEIASFQKMKPVNSLFPQILTEIPGASVHPFCLQALDLKSLMHARHFSSPNSETVEDPVTGTASGVMGAYYLKYLERGLRSISFDVEQGQEISRDGQVSVEVNRINPDDLEVFISGTAVYVKDLTIEYE